MKTNIIDRISNEFEYIKTRLEPLKLFLLD